MDGRLFLCALVILFSTLSNPLINLLALLDRLMDGRICSNELFYTYNYCQRNKSEFNFANRHLDVSPTNVLNEEHIEIENNGKGELFNKEKKIFLTIHS